METSDLTTWGLNKAIFDVINDGFCIDEETGEVLFDSSDLERLQGELDEKLNSICGAIKYYSSKADEAKARKEAIDKNMKYYNNKADKLNEFLLELMQGNNIKKKELADYRLGTRKSSSVQISDEERVLNYLNDNPLYAEECVTTQTVTKINKSNLKKVMTENDVTIPGALIVEKQNVTIS